MPENTNCVCSIAGYPVKDTTARAAAAAAAASVQEETEARNDLYKFVCPEMYRGDPDDPATDTEAVQACFAAARSSGLPIRLAGTYTITESMEPFDHMTIYGGGRVNISIPFLSGATPVMMVKIKDIWFNNTGTTENSIDICCYWSNIENCEFFGGNAAIRLNNGSASGTLVENRILNCTFRSCNTAISTEGGNKITDGHIDNCYCMTYTNGIVIGSAAGWQISNVHVYGNAGSGINLTDAFCSTITNAYTEGGSYGLYAHTQVNLAVSNSVFRDATTNDIKIVKSGYFPNANYKQQLPGVYASSISSEIEITTPIYGNLDISGKRIRNAAAVNGIVAKAFYTADTGTATIPVYERTLILVGFADGNGGYAVYSVFCNSNSVISESSRIAGSAGASFTITEAGTITVTTAQWTHGWYISSGSINWF